MEKKVKNILFRVELEGNGIVNYDSGDQKFIYNGTNLSNTMGTSHNNVSYAKKNFINNGVIVNKDGKEVTNLSFKLKISSDCIKKSLFAKDLIAQTPNIGLLPELLYSYIASPAPLLRGYMFATKEATYIKKGALTIVDAIQTCNAKSIIETHCRSGEKTEKTDKDDKSDTTFYSKETVGDIKYETKGNINLSSLQLSSCDKVFGRYGFDPDYFDIFKGYLEQNLKGFNSELGYYMYNTSSVKIPEYGIKFSNDNIVELVRVLFTKFLELNINRKSAYAKTNKLQYKLVYDCIEDTFNSDDNWITINSYEDIDKIDFETYDFYSEYNRDEAIKLRKEIVDKLEEAKKKEKEAKKKQKNKKVDNENEDI